MHPSSRFSTVWRILCSKSRILVLSKKNKIHTTIICLTVLATREGSIRYRSCIPNSATRLLGCDLYQIKYRSINFPNKYKYTHWHNVQQWLSILYWEHLLNLMVRRLKNIKSLTSTKLTFIIEKYLPWMTMWYCLSTPNNTTYNSAIIAIFIGPRHTTFRK